MEQGFIKLSRKFFNHFLWCEPRELSRAEAWLDLIYSARIDAGKQIIQGRVIELDRGELLISVRYLATRWKWGEKKIRIFLKLLENERMVAHRKTQGFTILTLCKYDHYNKSGQTEDTPKGTEGAQQWHTEGTEGAQNKRKKEEKELKNDKKELEERTQEFKDDVFSFEISYPSNMLTKFFDYWSELNKSQTKMRFELEKTWELPKRLKTWADREKTDKPKSQGHAQVYHTNGKYEEF